MSVARLRANLDGADLVQTRVDDFVRDMLEVIGDPHPGRDEAADVLVGHHVPDAVAREDKKLVFVGLTNLVIKFRFRRHELKGAIL